MSGMYVQVWDLRLYCLRVAVYNICIRLSYRVFITWIWMIEFSLSWCSNFYYAYGVDLVGQFGVSVLFLFLVFSFVLIRWFKIVSGFVLCISSSFLIKEFLNSGVFRSRGVFFDWIWNCVCLYRYQDLENCFGGMHILDEDGKSVWVGYRFYIYGLWFS